MVAEAVAAAAVGARRLDRAVGAGEPRVAEALRVLAHAAVRAEPRARHLVRARGAGVPEVAEALAVLAHACDCWGGEVGRRQRGARAGTAEGGRGRRRRRRGGEGRTVRRAVGGTEGDDLARLARVPRGARALAAEAEAVARAPLRAVGGPRLERRRQDVHQAVGARPPARRAAAAEDVRLATDGDGDRSAQRGRRRPLRQRLLPRRERRVEDVRAVEAACGGDGGGWALSELRSRKN